jgi:hypothetical protein
MDITFIYTAGSNGQHGIFGRKDTATAAAEVLTRVYGRFIDKQPGVAIQLAPEFELANLDAVNQAWWTTNISGITGSSLWTYDAVSKFYEMN